MFFCAGRLTYSELLNLHTEDAAVVLFLAQSVGKEHRDVVEVEQEIVDVRAALAGASAQVNQIEWAKLHQTLIPSTLNY